MHPEAEAFRAILYGSLSKTGKGHGTDRAIIQTMSPVPCEVVFSEDELPEMKHPNTMDLIVVSGGEETVRQRFYSIGGGDIRIEGRQTDNAEQDVYMENSFAEIKQFCQCSYIDLLHYIEINEADDIWGYLGEVWQTMKNSIRTGLSKEGILPGGLNIKRKAKQLYTKELDTQHPEVIECQRVCAYAYAVSEQNADNGIIVTAPTCGSCGVLPAVHYYLQEKKNFPDDKIVNALAIAGIFGEVLGIIPFTYLIVNNHNPEISKSTISLSILGSFRR